MRRIFISHRNGRSDELAFIRRLQSELTGLGFDVLVDFDRLQPGSTLREDIYTWLGICHAAIVLLSPEALGADSAWVPTESSILAWRKTLDRDFVLIPVLMPGVEVDHLRDHLRFRDLGLHDLLCITHQGEDATCTRIVAALESIKPALLTPLEDLAEQIQAMLVGISDDFLDETIRLTAVNVARLPRGMARARTAALAMLQAPLSDTVTALEYLVPRLQNPVQIDRILDIVAPTWVSIDAARWIAFCASLPSPRPGAVVNVATQFGAAMYVRRACSRPPKTMWRLVSITSVFGETVFDDLAVEIQAALEAEFASVLLADPFSDKPENQLTHLLNELSRRGRPVVVVMRLPNAVGSLMPSLQDRFPTLTFLFISGERMPDDEHPISLLRHVDPVLETGREIAAQTEYIAARSVLRSTTVS